MKKLDKNFAPLAVNRSNAIQQIRKSDCTEKVVIVNNRSDSVAQRKIQQQISVTPRLAAHVQWQQTINAINAPVAQRKILKNAKTKKVTANPSVIERLDQSGFFTNLTTDDQRAWARVLHQEDKIYTQVDALNEITNRINAKMPLPVVADKEDPQMRQLIEQHQSGPSKSRKQDRQVDGMHGLYENGTQTEKDQMIAHLKQPANAKGFTEAVRQGELNETLLTSDTRDAALRSLGANVGSGVQTHAETTAGEKVYWTDYQSDTSYPTKYFTFPETTTDADGNKIQDTHINGSTYREDSDGKKHLTVGSTSQEYHFGIDESLAANFSASTRVQSLARRNAKFHRKSLATREDILATDASERAEQMYRTTNGTVLNLNDEADLERYAEHVHIHTAKVNTALFRQARRFKVDGNESESDVSDMESEDQVDMYVDTDDEAEERIEKRKNASKGNKKIKKVKIIL